MHDRARDLPERPGPEPHDRHGQVLDLGVVVGDVGEHGLHRRRRAEHPLQGVDVVNGVVEGAPAALALPGSAPPQVVVAGAAPPQGIDLGVQHPAGPARVKHLLQPGHRRGEPVLGDHRQDRAAAPRGGQDGVAFGQRGSHRLLAQGVDARGQQGRRDLGVRARRRAHRGQIDPLPTHPVPAHHLADVGGRDRAEAVPGDLLFGPRPVDVHHGHDAAAAGKREISLDVEAGDRSRPDDGNVDHRLPSCRPAMCQWRPA